MSSFAGLGIKKGWTYEAVITCFDGIVPHASPFGIRCPDNKIIQLEIYKGSNTLEYIMEKKDFVVNFVHNYEYFFNSLYDQRRLQFTNGKNLKAPVIKDCPAFIEAKMIGSKNNFRSYILDAEIISINIDKPPRLFNRAESLVVESLITATRIKHMADGDAEELLKENFRIIKKVAPDSKYVEIMEKLLNKCLFHAP